MPTVPQVSANKIFNFIVDESGGHFMMFEVSQNAENVDQCFPKPGKVKCTVQGLKKTLCSSLTLKHDWKFTEKQALKYQNIC